MKSINLISKFWSIAKKHKYNRIERSMGMRLLYTFAKDIAQKTFIIAEQKRKTKEILDLIKAATISSSSGAKEINPTTDAETNARMIISAHEKLQDFLKDSFKI
jgi:hypothetical protein